MSHKCSPTMLFVDYFYTLFLCSHHPVVGKKSCVYMLCFHLEYCRVIKETKKRIIFDVMKKIQKKTFVKNCLAYFYRSNVSFCDPFRKLYSKWNKMKYHLNKVLFCLIISKVLWNIFRSGCQDRHSKILKVMDFWRWGLIFRLRVLVKIC